MRMNQQRTLRSDKGQSEKNQRSMKYGNQVKKVFQGEASDKNC